jgi:hypothetical protein
MGSERVAWFTALSTYIPVVTFLILPVGVHYFTVRFTKKLMVTFDQCT